MKLGVILYAIAVAMIVYGFIDPARKHNSTVDKNEIEGGERRADIIRNEFVAGNSAYRTNTNLVGIRIVLNRIHAALWVIAALLLIIATPRLVSVAW